MAEFSYAHVSILSNGTGHGLALRGLKRETVPISPQSLPPTTNEFSFYFISHQSDDEISAPSIH